jgi:hypothetical protein
MLATGQRPRPTFKTLQVRVESWAEQGPYLP